MLSRSLGKSIPFCDRSRHVGVFGQPVNAQLVGDVIEENVAAFAESTMERNIAMPGVFPTAIIIAIKRRAAGTMKFGLIVNGSRFQTSQRRKGLKRRTRREFRLGRAIQQRLVQDRS